MTKKQPKPQDVQGAIVSRTQQVEMYRQGPLPAANEFARYEEVCPGAAATILRMAEQEQLHRHKTELAILAAEQEDIRLTHRENVTAYWMSFVVVMGFLGLGFTLTLHNHDSVGAIMMGTGLVGVIGSFLRRSQPKK